MVRTGSAVRPAKEGAEDTPALAVGRVLWVATVEMPYVSAHIVRARAISSRVVDVGAKQVVKRILLERANGLGKQPCANEEQEVGHDDQEDRKR